MKYMSRLPLRHRNEREGGSGRRVAVALAMVFLLALLACLGGCSRDPKVVAQRYVESGNKYYERGKLKEAAIMYRKALQKDARNPQAYYKLGLVDLKAGALADARQMFLRASELDRNNLDAFAKLGDLDMGAYMVNPTSNKSLLPECRDAVKTILKKDPHSYDGLRLSGFLALADKDVKTAIAQFRAANQTKPDQPDLLQALAQSLFVDQQNDAGEQVARHGIQVHKDYGPLYDTLYAYYAGHNRIADAESILKQKVANNPKSGAYMVELATFYLATNRRPDMEAVIARLSQSSKMIAGAHLYAGDFFMRLRDLDRAQAQYKKGEIEDPNNRHTYLKREAEVAVSKGKREEAGKVVAELLKDDPKDPDAIVMKAGLLLESRKPDDAQKAIDELQPIIATIPQTPGRLNTLRMLHFTLARAYLLKNDAQSHDQARLQLQETLKVAPSYAPAKVLLAEVLLSRRDFGNAAKLSAEVVAQQPNNLTARLLHSAALVNLGERDRARTEIEDVLKVSPNLPDARAQLGNLEMLNGDYAKAQTDFEALRQANDIRGAMGMVEVKVRQRDYPAAIKILNEQIAKTPKDQRWAAAAANVEFIAHDYQNAEAGYRSLIAQNPNSADLYIRLAQVQTAAQDTNGAIASLTKAKQLAPNSAAPALQLGVLLDSAGRKDEARREYEQVLKIEPDNPIALNNLAYAKAEAGVDLDQALILAQRAKQKMPNDPNIADTLGLIYLRKNLTDQSLGVLGDLVKRVPAVASFHLHYAMALNQKGDKSGARRELDVATQHNPSDRDKEQIRALQSRI